MNTPSSPAPRLLAALGLALALAAPACTPKADAPAPEPATPKAVAPAADAPAAAPEAAAAPAPEAPAPAAAGNDGACGKFAGGICEVAGPDSDACAAVTLTMGLLSDKTCEVAVAELPAAIDKLKGLRQPCTDLVNRLCKDLGEQTATCGMVRMRTPQFKVESCLEMTAQYAQVLGELQAMERANGPLPDELAAKQAANDGPSYGPADAKVVVVEYSDFQCPFCSRAADTLNKLKARYGTAVRFVFRQLPLPMHPDAPLAAEASLAAHAQGRFWEMHDKMFANQGSLDRESLERYAAEVGLDMARFKKALDEGTHKAEVARDVALAEQVGADGTPTLFVGGQRVMNAIDVAAMSAAIEAALQKAGVPVPEAKE